MQFGVEPEQALQPVLGHDAVFDELDPFSVHPVGTQVHETAEVDVVEVDVVDVDVVVVVQLLAATALHVYVPQTDLKYELNDFDFKFQKLIWIRLWIFWLRKQLYKS